MKDFFKIICCLSFISVWEVIAMEKNNILDYYKSVIQKTKLFSSAEKHCEDVINAYGGSDLPINWSAIKDAAEEGDPIAQYCHAKHCLAAAVPLFNGEKQTKKIEAYMFMLISAIFGKLEDSRTAFTYVGNIDSLNKEENGETFLKTAISFSHK